MCKVCIFIPVHSSAPTTEELLSFAQCFKVLFNHDIFVVHPKGLDLRKYLDVVPVFNTKEIAPEWQSSLKDYNILKSNIFFYELFSEYEYLLTYELDAFVFSDELIFWCKKGYDYIGAPWVEGWGTPVKPINLIGVGNSGFSLRNIHKCRRMIKRIVQIKSIKSFLEASGLSSRVSLKSFLGNRMIKKFFMVKDVDHLIKFLAVEYCAEDGFWAIWIGRIFSDFKVAPVAEAIPFSFELASRELFELNNKTLPFGCHAWARYDTQFWSHFIKPLPIEVS